MVVSGLLLEVAHNPFLPVFCLFYWCKCLFFSLFFVPFLSGCLKLVLFLIETESIIIIVIIVIIIIVITNVLPFSPFHTDSLDCAILPQSFCP